jgi:hypothetical protein
MPHSITSVMLIKVGSRYRCFYTQKKFAWTASHHRGQAASGLILRRFLCDSIHRSYWS